MIKIYPQKSQKTHINESRNWVNGGPTKVRFEIRHVKNGLVLSAHINDDVKEELVYQEKYDDDDEIECFADFLRLLVDHYGPSTSRYSPKRINVNVEPCDKYEGTNKV